MRKSLLMAILLLASVSVIGAQAQARLPIAVLDLEPKGINLEKGLVDVISERVRYEFGEYKELEVVSREKMVQTAAEKSLPLAGCVDIACAVQIGKALGVKKLVLGSFCKLGQKYQVYLRVVDIGTENVECNAMKEGVLKVENISSLVPPAVRQVSACLLGSSKPAPPGPTPESPVAPTKLTATGRLRVTSKPPGAKITVDGVAQGSTPRLVAKLEVGEHLVMVAKEGFKPYSEKVQVKSSGQALVNVKLEKLFYGRLKVTSQPVGAEVFLDSLSKGTTPLAGLAFDSLEAKSYKLLVTAKDYEPYEAAVTLAPNEAKTVEAVLVSRSISVSSTPPGASVLVNGQTKGQTPCLVTGLAPGKYPVKVTKEGYEDFAAEVAVELGQIASLNAELIPLPEGFGYLGVNAQGFKQYRNLKDGSTLIEIPSGEFTMGANDGESVEKPVRQVTLTKYYIGQYEVTVGQFKRFCEAMSRPMPAQPSWSQGDNYPVVSVSWEDALAYCDWAGLRLPTEAEWERAARGAEGHRYPWGNEWDASKCNSKEKGDGFDHTAPVGSFPQGVSPCGASDMAGNVSEGCRDWFFENYYKVSMAFNPKGPLMGKERVVRGGGWDSLVKACRATNRDKIRPEAKSESLGFRVAK
jgi:formylglycine-generating enzyme required for sulfatase activity/TolB-like protein